MNERILIFLLTNDDLVSDCLLSMLLFVVDRISVVISVGCPHYGWDVDHDEATLEVEGG